MNEITDQTVSAIVAKARSSTPTSDDFRAALKQPIITELSGWELWPLVGFVRHERRQKWVGYIVESKLNGSGSELASSGALGHPNGMKQEGDVPDNPGWRYSFHGRGCCLTHSDGTSIDVDFADDGSATEIDPYFFSQFLASAAKLEWTDAHLRHAPPLENAWQFDLRRLSDLGFVEGKSRFCLTDKGRQLVEHLEPIVDEINRLSNETSANPRMTTSWLLTLLGDVSTAANVPDHIPSEIADVVGHAATISTKERAAILRAAVRSNDEGEHRLALMALAALGRQHVEREVLSTMESTPPSSLHLLSLRILESWNDPSCEPMLLAALHRFFLSPNGTVGTQVQGLRNNFLALVAKLLLSYHTPSSISKPVEEMLHRVLESDLKTYDARAGFLLYLLSPALGLQKVKAATRNPIPMVRQEAAVFLGMIRTDDAINALLEVAAGQPEHGGHEAACVLATLTDQRALTALANWRRRNDGYEEAEPNEIDFKGRNLQTWKMNEVMRANISNIVQRCSETLQREYGQLLLKWSAVL